MPTDTGGKAFPLMINPDAEPGSTDLWCHQGMTLRDYFAGQALMGLLSQSVDCYAESMPACATDCYAYADAMIRKKGGKHAK